MSVKIALAGNPNSGKTTLFNVLTGLNQFVGNWPGVTVEKKEGRLKFDKEAEIIDLPGIYSLSSYTPEEVVARNFLINERPDAIVNIVDGTNIERNLYLSTQLMELGIPVVMAVNMMDVVNKSGDSINVKKLGEKLGCEVIEISALKGVNVQQVARKAVELAKSGKLMSHVHSFDARVEDIIHEVEANFTGVSEERRRFLALKLLEKDEKITDLFKGITNENPDVQEQINALEKLFDDDMESIIANERYVYISSIIKDCCKKSRKTGLTVSDKIDRIVTNRILALPIFAIVMALVYYISMSTVGTGATDWTNDRLFGDGWHLFGIGNAEYDEAVTEYAVKNIWTPEVRNIVDAAAASGVIGAEDIRTAMYDEDFGGFEEAYGTYGDVLVDRGFDISGIVDEAMDEAPDTADYGIWMPSVPALAENLLDAVQCADWLKGLIIDGIVGGVGSVLGFLPQMLVLFIFLAFLEGCGYMARVAFIMDRIFRKFGLSGKSFIPMLIGTGCGVPGIMASRTIENDRDRKMTIMTTTFIPCGAKLPIIALITAALFDGAWWVAPSAYFLGVAAIIISGIILKKTKMFAGDPAPFVMELPAYHLPTMGSVLRSMWERGWSFIKKAGTIILLSSIIIWAGSCFGVVDGSLMFDAEMELDASILGIVGGGLGWIFAPLGFNETKAVIATIMGLVAKEEVVGVFGVLDFEDMTRIAGYSFLAFNLLCAPCFAAMGAIKREMNNKKWFWFAIGYQCVFAYAISLMIYQIGSALSGNMNIIGLIAAVIVAAGIIYLLVRPYCESSATDVEYKFEDRNKAA